MAIPGTGCFIAWYDLKPGRESDHDHWHTHEHMIERVAIPGFRRGLRYRALAGGARVCVIYHADSVETLCSPAYFERLNNPTPWTVRSMALAVDTNRTLCSVAATHGHGTGGYLLTAQVTPRASNDDRLRRWLCDEALPGLAARAGLCGAHLLIADRETSGVKTQEKELRGAPDAIADWVVLVEGYHRPAVEQARAELCGVAGLLGHGASEPLTAGLYSLDFTLDESEAKKLWQKPAP